MDTKGKGHGINRSVVTETAIASGHYSLPHDYGSAVKEIKVHDKWTLQVACQSGGCQRAPRAYVQMSRSCLSGGMTMGQ